MLPCKGGSKHGSIVPNVGITVLSTFIRSLKVSCSRDPFTITVTLPSSPHRLICSRVQIVGRSDQGNYYDREAEI